VIRQVQATAPPRRTRRRELHVVRPDHASERVGFCRTGRRASALVSRRGYRAHFTGSRFLEVDPAEGGSCNDYDYVCADPVNAFDLTGTVCFHGHCVHAPPVVNHAIRHVGHAARFVGTRLGAQAGGCFGYVLAYCASVGVNFRDGFYFSHGGGHGLGATVGVNATWQSGATARTGDCHTGGVVVGGGACFGGHRQIQGGWGPCCGGYFHTRYTTYSTRPW
jgi:hypothetical protein